MTSMLTRCRQSGTEFEPSPDAIRAGAWRLCPACALEPESQHRCRECGRLLRLTNRSFCARRMGVSL
jgi:hypothetical protein